MVNDVSFRDAWVGASDCANCASREFSLFSGVNDTDLTDGRSQINSYQFKHGSVVYRSEEKGLEIFSLKSGLIKLERFLPDGSQRIVRLIHPNDVFGIEVLVSQAYEHDAVVLEEALLCKIPSDLVHALAGKNPKLHREIMNRWQSALSEADSWLTELLTGTAKQRVARLLLKLVDDSNDRCSLLSREDMGAILSVTTETASRIVAEFKRKGYLQEIAMNTYRCDVAALTGVATN